MAAVLPGSYPDSIPPTPEETMQQPTQPPQPEALHHRQRNKLHRPGDPRGHKYTDSGVGMTDPEYTQFSQSTESNWTGPDEAVGGGTYARDHTQPTAPLESIRADLDTTPTQQTENDAAFSSKRDSGVAAGTTGMMAQAERLSESQSERPSSSENTETTTRSYRRSGDSPPYWGDLPKGTDGRVYNTVTGHGSATDDHDEHHHMPPKSASQERTVIPGHGANFPRGGGVYNTVVGHGSQDDEARRHSQSRSTEGTSTAVPAAGPVNDSMLAAPLPDIPEEKQKTSHQAAFADTPDIAPGFLPETAVRDDVLLAEAAKRNAGGSHSPPKAESSAHRAFPLVGAHTDKSNDQRKSASPSRYGAAAGAAGLAAGAAGAAATENLGKRRQGSTAADQSRRRSKSPRMDDNTQPTGGVVGGKRESSRQRSPIEKPASHEESSPKSEKRHSLMGIFHRHKDDSPKGRRKSVGHHPEPVKDDTSAVNSPNRLRKQSKGEAALGHRRSASNAEAETEDHTGHGKEKAAAGAAAGAGMFGLLHHRKNNSVSEQPHDITRPIRSPKTAETGGAGPAGEAPYEGEAVSTPFEHPREPPMPPYEAEGHSAGGPGQFGSSGVSHATQPSTRGATTNEPNNYNTLAFGTPSGVNAVAGSGSTRNIQKARESGGYNEFASTSGPAPETMRRDVVSRDHGDYNVLASSGAPATEATRRDVVGRECGDYNVLESSGAPRAADRARGTVTQEPGNYNTLASGIPSGIKQDAAHSGSLTGERNTGVAKSGSDDVEPEYNILPSGTASGVKVKPRSPRHSRDATDSAARGNGKAGNDEYNHLPSGTASGINPETRHSTSNQSHQQAQSAADMTSRARDLNDFPVPNTQREAQPQPNSLTATIPSHVRSTARAHPNPSQESVPGVTTYPHPEMVHNMSPEVMPDAYTASAPQGQPQAKSSQGMREYPPPDLAKSMSPEVMPAAYTATAPRSTSQVQGHGQGQGQGYGQTHGTQHYPPTEQTAKGLSPEIMPDAYTSSAPRPHQGEYHLGPQQMKERTGNGNVDARDPALAAATSSWAATAGRSSGVGGGVGQGQGQGQGSGMGSGRMMHRCQHCGGENDVSGLVERFARGMGMGQSGQESGY